MAAVLLVAPAAVQAAPILSIQPPVTNVLVNDVFVLDVLATDADDLFAFDVELNYDATIIEALSFTPGTFLGSTVGVDVDLFSDFIDNIAGEASGAQSRLVMPGVTGTGVLFSITFKAIAPGTTNVDFDVACDANDPFCTALRNSADLPVDYATQFGIVNVDASSMDPIPEPTTWLLVASGLAARLRQRLVRRGHGR